MDNNKLELTGSIKKIAETKTFPSGFKKREFVITTEEKYPQDIQIETVKDNCEKLDKYKVGDRLTVKCNVKGNEYNGRHYVSISAWSFHTTKTAPPEPDVSDFEGASNDDEVPF